MDEHKVRTTQVGWSVRSWCSDTDLSQAYVYQLLAAKRIDSVKIGKKRLIMTPPADFLESLRETA